MSNLQATQDILTVVAVADGANASQEAAEAGCVARAGKVEDFEAAVHVDDVTVTHHRLQNASWKQ